MSGEGTNIDLKNVRFNINDLIERVGSLQGELKEISGLVDGFFVANAMKMTTQTRTKGKVSALMKIAQLAVDGKLVTDRQDRQVVHVLDGEEKG